MLKNFKTSEILILIITIVIIFVSEYHYMVEGDVKEILRKQREELHCEYSGLPSVKAYES